MPKADVKSIAIEIAMVGVNSIDSHSKYIFKSIPNKELSWHKDWKNSRLLPPNS